MDSFPRMRLCKKKKNKKKKKKQNKQLTSSPSFNLRLSRLETAAAGKVILPGFSVIFASCMLLREIMEDANESVSSSSSSSIPSSLRTALTSMWQPPQDTCVTWNPLKR